MRPVLFIALFVAVNSVSLVTRNRWIVRAFALVGVLMALAYALTSCAPVVDIASSASSGDASTSSTSDGGAGGTAGSAVELHCNPSHECGTKPNGAACELVPLDLVGTCAHNPDGGAPKCCAFTDVH